MYSILKITVWGTQFLITDLNIVGNAYVLCFELPIWGNQFLTKTLYMQWISYVFNFKSHVWGT